MRYQKPIVLDLNQRTRPVYGGPDACLPGATAGGACAMGTSPDYSPCAPGGGDPSGDCATGDTNAMNCLSGGVAGMGTCNMGETGFPDTTGCAVGNAP